LIVDFIPTTSNPLLPPVLNGAIAPHHPPALTYGFSGEKKNIKFYFRRNIARVKIVP